MAWATKGRKGVTALLRLSKAATARRDLAVSRARSCLIPLSSAEKGSAALPTSTEPTLKTTYATPRKPSAKVRGYDLASLRDNLGQPHQPIRFEEKKRRKRIPAVKNQKGRRRRLLLPSETMWELSLRMLDRRGRKTRPRVGSKVDACEARYQSINQEAPAGTMTGPHLPHIAVILELSCWPCPCLNEISSSMPRWSKSSRSSTTSSPACNEAFRAT